MNIFSIPEKLKPVFGLLLKLSHKNRADLIKALSTARPTLTMKDLSNAIAPRVSVPSGQLHEILRMLGGMYLASVDAETDIEEFVEGVIEYAKEAEGLPRTGSKQWGEFKTDLTRILLNEKTLGTTAKALSVVIENERLLCSDNSRIVTDMRPIYGADVKDSPDAAVITHLFKLAFHEGPEMELKENYFAMNTADLRVLRRLLDRALAKDESLRAKLKKSGFDILESDSAHEH